MHAVTPDFTVQITPTITTISTTSTPATATGTASTSSVSARTTSATTMSTFSIPPLPTCLIATATYDSDIAPEVQILRDFRDNSIMKTVAGSSFMTVFNSWYYSFSPQVAANLQANLAERTIMKVVLYPLIGTLWLSSATFDLFRSYPEVAILLSGLMASSLIGAIYLGIPFTFIRIKVKRLHDARRQRLLQFSLVIILFLGLCGLGLGESLLISPLLTLSTVTIILSTLCLSSTVTANKIANALERLGYWTSQSSN